MLSKKEIEELGIVDDMLSCDICSIEMDREESFTCNECGLVVCPFCYDEDDEVCIKCIQE